MSLNFHRHLLRLAVVLGGFIPGAVIPTFAHAQPAAASGDWLLLPIGDQEQAASLISRLRAPLADSPASALDDEDAALAFEEALSTPPQSVTESELDAWADHSRDALQYLAGGDYDRARAELLAAQDVSERAAEEMNRSAERARRVLDTCLYMARALIETRQHMEAREQVHTCRVLVPKVEPGGFRHPPEVRAMLERVDAEEHNANLEVTSSPSGCLVRINGVPQGETPFAMENVARGDYRIQVECTEQRGRVHRARVDHDDERAVSVHVDAAFDAAVHSRPFLYAESGFALQSVALAAASMARPVLALSGQGDDLSLWLVEASAAGVRVTSARSTRATLGDALGALHERRSLDFRQDTPTPIAEVVLSTPRLGVGAAVNAAAASAAGSTAEDDDAILAAAAGTHRALPIWRLGAGFALLGTGLAGVGAGTILHFQRAETGDFYAGFTDPGQPGYLANLDAWTSSQLTPTAAFALGGSAAAAVGVGLLIPAHEKVQWWAWALGGVGVVLGGVSLIPILTRPECGDVASVTDQQHAFCIERDMAASKTVILAGAALPFLAIPISALIQSGSQRGGDGDAEDGQSMTWFPNISVSPTSLSLSISGRLP